ncbi:hypothetical protein ACXYMX_06000 [Sporosarcina sp. CAU 1771]
MEGLIPLIIMLLIGSFFSSKKKKPQDKGEVKTFTAQETQSGPMGKLKEMYEEIQREMQPEVREREIEQNRQMAAPVSPPVVSVREQVPIAKPQREIKRVESKSRKTGSTDRSRQRGNRASKSTSTQKSLSTTSFIPENKDDLIKGVIFSEIFGPPISKR